MAAEDSFTEHLDTKNSAVQRNKGWLLTVGVLLIVLGGVGLSMLAVVDLQNLRDLGAIVAVAGLLVAINGAIAEGGRDKHWQIALGLIYLVGGVVMLLYPAASAAGYALVVAALLLVTGVRRIVLGLQLRRFMRGWGWTVCTGTLSLVLAVLIYGEWPLSGMWAVWLFVALELILHGSSMVALAVRGE